MAVVEQPTGGMMSTDLSVRMYWLRALRALVLAVPMLFLTVTGSMAQTPPKKVFVPDGKGDVSDAVGAVIASEICGALVAHQIEALTYTNLKSQLGEEQKKELLGCTESGCMDELITNFGIADRIFCQVTRLGKDDYHVELSHFVKEKLRPGGKVLETVRCQEGNLPAVAARMALKLLGLASDTPVGAGLQPRNSGNVRHGVELDQGESIVNALTDETGYLVVETEPSGATVLINGKEVGKSPKQLESMVGRYVVVAELGKLYYPARQEVDLTSQGAEVKLKLLPAHGKLAVKTEPRDALIWLDGEKAGTGQYENAMKPSGKYELRVERANYLSWRGEVVVEDGKETIQKVELEQNFGSLEVTSSPPGASILLDGKETGKKTPAVFGVLEPGVYSVKLVLEGYGEVVANASVENRRNAVVNPVLQAKLGLVSIMATYTGGEMCRGKVYVDGEEKGVTPAKVEVTAREHEIRVVCEKGEKKEKVRVEHNQKLSLNWELAQDRGLAGKAGIEWVSSQPAGLYFARTETTVEQYRACVRAGACKAEHHKTKSDAKYCNWGYGDRDEHPMNCVDWYGAEQFCEWAGGRLPTEEEWSAEASDGGTREYPWGTAAPTCAHCIMDDGQTKGSAGSETDGCGKDSTWPVCSKKAGNSVSGLCDMSGNVWEWTSSLDGSARVVRGGSWYYDNPRSLRAAARVRLVPDYGYSFYGVRCVRLSR